MLSLNLPPSDIDVAYDLRLIIMRMRMRKITQHDEQMAAVVISPNPNFFNSRHLNEPGQHSAARYIFLGQEVTGVIGSRAR